MKKLMYMGLGMLAGGAVVAIMYNAKPITVYLKKSKDSMLITLNDYMDELALLVEEIDEEKVKQKLKMKYNQFKKRIDKINLENIEENMKDKINGLIDEVKQLIDNTKPKELEQEQVQE